MAWPTQKPSSLVFDDPNDKISDSRPQLKIMSDAVRSMVDFIDTTDIADERILVYNASTGKLEFETSNVTGANLQFNDRGLVDGSTMIADGGFDGRGNNLVTVESITGPNGSSYYLYIGYSTGVGSEVVATSSETMGPETTKLLRFTIFTENQDDGGVVHVKLRNSTLGATYTINISVYAKSRDDSAGTDVSVVREELTAL